MKTTAVPKLGFKKNYKFLILILGIFSVLVLVTFLFSKPTPKTSLPNQIFETQNFSEFEKYALEFGVEKSYTILKKKYPKNDTQAHDFAHIVGIVSYEKEGVKGLQVCDTAYNYGCYHGFTESFLVKNGVGKVWEIEKSCIALGSVHAPSCLHGIGHGLMINASYKLEEALFDCDRLKIESRIYCWDGVFMERITGSMQSLENQFVLGINTLKEPCRSLKPVYKKQCYRNQVSAWLQYFKGNTKEVAKQCEEIEREFSQICFESMGNLVAMSAGENKEKILSLCQVLENGRFSDDCLLGVMDELMFEGKSPQLAQSLCNSVLAHGRENCQTRFQRLLAEYKIRFGR